MSSTPSMGLVIGLPIMAVIVLILVAVGILMFRVDDPYGDLMPLGFGALILAVLIMGATAFAMWPYSSEYHEWRPTSGTVAGISSRMVSAGDSSMEQRFVVMFTDGRQRACDDTRCATVKTGDVLSLKCKRAYQWSASPGWDCNWIGVRRT